MTASEENRLAAYDRAMQAADDARRLVMIAADAAHTLARTAAFDAYWLTTSANEKEKQ